MSRKRRINPMDKMIQNLNQAMEDDYAEEIRPMIQEFSEKCLNGKIWEGTTAYYMQNLTHLVKHIAMNTRKNKLNEEEVKTLIKIFEEVDVLYTEILALKKKKGWDTNFINKIQCLNEILYDNVIAIKEFPEGMIFQNYENIWKIFHRINTEWADLCYRGFSVKVFYDYWQFLKYEKSEGIKRDEKEKLEIFMDILDGKMKFIPIYKKIPICFAVVKSECKDKEIVKIEENEYCKSYRLKKK